METKIFPYAVIWGGEIIPPNTPIKVKKPKTEEPKKAVKENDGGANSEA